MANPVMQLSKFLVKYYNRTLKRELLYTWGTLIRGIFSFQEWICIRVMVHKQYTEPYFLLYQQLSRVRTPTSTTTRIITPTGTNTPIRSNLLGLLRGVAEVVEGCVTVPCTWTYSLQGPNENWGGWR